MSDKRYLTSVSRKKLRQYGQFFTPKKIANDMIRWIIKLQPNNLLDPAVGNGRFFNVLDKTDNKIKKYGYEIDKEILDYFEVDKKHVKFKDFLVSDWNKSYDAIICNPLYFYFPLTADRSLIMQLFEKMTGLKKVHGMK